jgi:hypothetical protein
MAVSFQELSPVAPRLDMISRTTDPKAILALAIFENATMNPFFF